MSSGRPSVRAADVDTKTDTSALLPMTARPPAPCEGAECTAKAETARWLCVICDCTYCDLCWDKQGPHRQGKLGHDGLPHEKTSEDLHLRLKSIFEPPEKHSELLKLHLEDEDTLWFGVDKDANGKCHFTETGRYSTLMTMTKQPTATERYPLLVSFVGQTGEGLEENGETIADERRGRQKHID